MLLEDSRKFTYAFLLNFVFQRILKRVLTASEAGKQAAYTVKSKNQPKVETALLSPPDSVHVVNVSPHSLFTFLTTTVFDLRPSSGGTFNSKGLITFPLTSR